MAATSKRFRLMPPILYLKDECHLCDEALLVLARAGVAEFKSVYIDEDASLSARYGMRVPVLRWHDGVELDWPFGMADVAALASA